ncbi:MAG: amidase family protein [Burkholderiaceae bacterium]
MKPDDLPWAALGAAGLARAIAAGEIGALEATEAQIERLEAANARLNAITVRRYDAARAEARAVDARRAHGQALPPLAGVPMTVKDCIDLAGTPSTFGLPWRRERLAAADEPHIARLRAAGAIPLAKTNVAQLLLSYESQNPLWGRSLHPENAERAPGGSSGGEAALVAAGGSLLGIGTDIGGSVRVPAHACGIAAFKPTAGRCDDPGEYSLHAGQRAIRSQIGALARRVEDLVLAMRHLPAGPDEGVPALAEPGSVDVRGLRVAWFDDDGEFPAAPACRRAASEAAQALARAGARVDRLPAFPFGALFDLSFELWTADRGRHLKRALAGGPADPNLKTLLALAGLPLPVQAAMGAALRALGQPSMARLMGHLGRDAVHDHWSRVQSLVVLRRACRRLLDDAPGGSIDLLLGPPCALPAYRHGTARDLGTAGAYALAANALGWPAGVVPWTRVRQGEESDRPVGRDRIQALAREVERGSAGLPVGVQLIGKPWRDHQVLAAMQALQDHRP